jgi:hypothetical protein
MPCRVSGNIDAQPLCMARSAISRPHRRVLEARALLVCHRRVWKISRSTIQGHRDGHATTHSPQSQATICRPLCPWMADRPPGGGVDLPKRTNTATTHGMEWRSLDRWRRTHRCFTVDVSVFMAHLPRKPFGSVKLGQKPPSFLASV